MHIWFHAAEEMNDILLTDEGLPLASSPGVTSYGKVGLETEFAWKWGLNFASVGTVPRESRTLEECLEMTGICQDCGRAKNMSG